MSLIWFLLFGFVVGLIARAVMPGSQKMGIIKTTLLGAVGSFVGGVIGNLITGDPFGSVHAAGWIGSIIGAVLLLALFGRNKR
jgi:uncharacterized membrane protein YeaQ/YmgE (transglycosylase-associated protein family)